MGTENKIFCVAPFTALRIETSGLGLTYKPGCVYSPLDKISSLDEFLNGAEMTKHRDNLCNGDVPSAACRRCKESEKLGLKSIRMHLNKKFPLTDKVDIRMLDIMFSNVCNLTCFMCNAESSSAISAERTSLKLIEAPVAHFDNADYAIEAIDRLPSLESVDLLGGEFFLYKNNAVLLDKFIERDLSVRLVTNATILSSAVIERLRKIKNLEIEISVDGVNDCYEFMRYPGKWAVTSENIKTLQRELPHAKMKFVCVVQPLNLQHIVETLEVLNTFKMQTHFQNLATPDYLSWAILTNDEKQALYAHIEHKLVDAKITSRQKSEIYEFMDGMVAADHNGQLRQQAIEFLGKTLAHRKLNHAIISNQFGIFKDFTTQLS